MISGLFVWFWRNTIFLEIIFDFMFFVSSIKSDDFFLSTVLRWSSRFDYLTTSLSEILVLDFVEGTNDFNTLIILLGCFCCCCSLGVSSLTEECRSDRSEIYSISRVFLFLFSKSVTSSYKVFFFKFGDVIFWVYFKGTKIFGKLLFFWKIGL